MLKELLMMLLKAEENLKIIMHDDIIKNQFDDLSIKIKIIDEKIESYEVARVPEIKKCSYFNKGFCSSQQSCQFLHSIRFVKFSRTMDAV